jgi:hypothetical protein
MSDLEFRRALSPDQMREALSLLDGAARAKLRNVQVEDSNPAEEVRLGSDHASTTTTAPNRLLAAEDAHQRRKRLNLVLVFYGLGIAAAAALTLLSWSERLLTPSGRPGIAGEQLQNPQPARLVNNASPAVPVVGPTSDQNPHGSVASATTVPQPNDGEDQAAEKGGTKRASAIPTAAQTATITAFATNPAWSDDRASLKPNEVWGHTPAVRAAAGKKRSWRRRWLPFAEINGGGCFHAACTPWQRQRALYEPPRNVTQ